MVEPGEQAQAHDTGDREHDAPVLSVVVPVHNVDRYVDECLQSVADQEVQDFEVVVVDDGSTDRSGEIAARWAAADRRFRIVRQDNHGLGHARNTGLDHVSGWYVTFLDGDDKATVNGYKAMVDALEKSGSDFATSNVHRFDSSGRTWQAPLYRWMKKDELLGTHVSETRILLKDHLACNKVFRTSFWNGPEPRFPVGVLYEDVPAVIPAQVRATSVDVVPVVSILWRVRDQGDSSITQSRRQEARHVRDRVDGILIASRYIGEHADSDLKDEYDAMVLGRDLRWYVDLYPELDGAYQDELFSSVKRFLAEVSPRALARTPWAMRIAYGLLTRDARDDFAAFVTLRRADQLSDLPVRIKDGRALLEPMLLGRTVLPDDIVDITDELRLVTRVSGLEIVDGNLNIDGWAYISRLPIDRPESHRVELWLERDGARIPAQVSYRRDDRAAEGIGAEAEASGKVAFTARIPLRKLAPRWQLRPREFSWTAMTSVTNDGIVKIGTLKGPLTGPAERPLMAPARGGRWVRVSWTNDGLICRVRHEAAILTEVHTDHAGIELVLQTNAPPSMGAKLRIRPPTRSPNSAQTLTYAVEADSSNAKLARVRIPVADLLSVPDAASTDTEAVATGALAEPSVEAVAESSAAPPASRLDATLPAEPFTEPAPEPAAEPSPESAAEVSPEPAARTWDLLYRVSKLDRWRRVLDPVGNFGHAVAVGESEVVVRRTRAATVALIRGLPTATLTGAEWRDTTLHLSMTYAGSEPVGAVVLATTTQSERLAFPVTGSGGDLRADLAVTALSRFGDTVPLRAGTWDLRIRTPGGERPMRVGRHFVGAAPITTVHQGRRYSLTDRRRTIVSLIVTSDLSPQERGPVNQRRLSNNRYPRSKTTLRDTVLYEAYFGKEFSDSPRVIYDELRGRGTDLEHLVVVRDQQFRVPDAATPIPYRSRRYYEALAQSKYVVANTHLPRFFRKAPGQVVLQTWHGVGTKKIGLDMDSVHFANKSYIDNIRAGESDNWDYLVSPNPFTSPILTRAFQYRGMLLETGVPRNDLFHRPEGTERATRVRERLGVAPGKSIVLYAPTWRDHLFDKSGRYRLDLRFDLHEAARRLGDDYTLVFRKHSNVVDRLPPGPEAVVDASDYPDVQDLLLVADILITDYSTLMCDFANTGRPMLFYTYDLTNYRDVLRGFYFDFETEVPGPLITDEADLLPAIIDSERIRRDYDDRYRAFAERFCPWDDGQAGLRVVDAVFGEVA